MKDKKPIKKHLITSLQRLSPVEQSAFNELYASGYSHLIQKITKPDGTNIFVVPFETQDAIYMIKVDVKIDSKISEEEFDKEIFASTKTEDDIDDANDDDEHKSDNSKFVLVHGDYSSVDTADESQDL
jgi:hypothetical protein